MAEDSLLTIDDLLTMDDYYSGLKLLQALRNRRVSLLSAFWRRREYSWAFTVAITENSGEELVRAQKAIDETVQALRLDNHKGDNFTIKTVWVHGPAHKHVTQVLKIQELIADPPAMGDFYIYPKHLLYREPVEA